MKPILDAFDGRWNIYSKIPKLESARRSLQWIFRRYESVFLARAKARGLQLGLVDPEEFWLFSVGVLVKRHMFFVEVSTSVPLLSTMAFIMMFWSEEVLQDREPGTLQTLSDVGTVVEESRNSLRPQIKESWKRL